MYCRWNGKPLTKELVVGPDDTMEIQEECFQGRKVILEIGDKVHSLMIHPIFLGEPTGGEQHGEMKANIMLAYRHLEDARMRLGKVVQAFDGGTSCYPK